MLIEINNSLTALKLKIISHLVRCFYFSFRIFGKHTGIDVC